MIKNTDELNVMLYAFIQNLHVYNVWGGGLKPQFGVLELYMFLYLIKLDIKNSLAYNVTEIIIKKIKLKCVRC